MPSVLFVVQDVYQGEPLPVAWAVSGATNGATATAEISIQGNVCWTSQPVALPMTRIQRVTVPPPAVPLVAQALYGTAPGFRTVHIDVIVTDGKGTTVYGADSTFFVFEPTPILETVTGITPGTPMKIFWSLDTAVLSGVAPVFVDLTAQVLLETPSGPAVIADIPSAQFLFGGAHGLEPFSWVITPPFAAIGYALGLHEISIAITLVSGGYRRTYSERGSYAVVPETIGPTFWQWSSPPGQIFTPSLPPPGNTPFLKASAGWNMPYTVGGRVVNRASTSVFRATVLLRQTPAWEEPPPPTSPLSTVSSVTVGPLIPGENDATGDALFPGQNQNYSWLDQATGLFSQGAVRQEVTYFASVTLMDSFGNTYPAFQSSSLSVDGSVPDSKLSAAITARAELALAVFWAMVAIETEFLFAGAFAALSTFFYLEFQQNINNAMDPPKPNLRYRRVVDLKPRRTPAALRAPQFSGLRELLELVSLVTHAQTTLSKIESRLLGAQRAKDWRGMQLQHSAYRCVLDQLRPIASALPQATALASADIVRLVDRPLESKYRGRVTTFRRRGLTPELRAKMTKAGIPSSALKGFRKAFKNTKTREALSLARTVSKAKGRTQLLTGLSQAVAALVKALLDEAEQRIPNRL